MDLRQRFKKRNPDFPLLELTEPRGVEDHLRSLDWLDEDEDFLGCSKAGEGNMNLALRIHAPERTFVVKQSRPWVEKYDQIEAPLDRSLVEAAFYHRVREIEGVGDRMPALLGDDAASRCLCFEDLGEGSDGSGLYRADEHWSLTVDDARQLAGYLSALHGATRGGGDRPGVLRNIEMRTLNHEHLFDLPLRSASGVDLEVHEPGLEEFAKKLRTDRGLVVAVRALGERYLEEARSTDVLLHGDFFPGCWLRAEGGSLKVIDPEFAWFGPPEFDWGVALGHLALSGRSREIAAAFLGAAEGLDRGLIGRFAGNEIVRRLIGVAQLPIPPSNGWRAEMLERSRSAMVNSDLEELWE